MAHFVLFINSFNKYILKYAITGLGTEAFVTKKKKKERNEIPVLMELRSGDR